MKFELHKLLTLLLLFNTFSIWSQEIIKGKIVDASSGKGIESANIFIANSSIGTSTNTNGDFVLKNVPNHSFELIISHVSYRTVFQKVEIPSKTLKIELNLSTTNLEEISINSKEDNKWKRMYSRFEEDFLGTSDNARQCEILNPYVINIKKEYGIIIARADEMLEIENKATGYTIKFLLEMYYKKGFTISYSGKPIFTELNSTTNYVEQRKKAFKGSMLHFMRALHSNMLDQEGFKIYSATLNNTDNTFTTKKKLKRSDIYSTDTLNFDHYLQVDYHGEPEEDAFVSAQFTTNSRALKNYQTSYLNNVDREVRVFSDGQIDHPEYLISYGYWSWERVADLMPFDYQLPSIVNETRISTKQVKKLNGFNLTNLLLPYSEIKQGGPQKDGIPAIDHPEFKSGDNIMDPDKPVLGVVANGIAKAYPIKIMDWHEIVNDSFDGQPVVITYCPLCGSGIAFLSSVAGQSTTFGVSGLIYNSDVLLYDRTTESLWSQLEMKAISGKNSGKFLTPLPTTYTTWGNWSEDHPSSLLLTENTGFKRNYDKSAYEGYEGTERLLFPVTQESSVLNNKEVVLGISYNGIHVAYPLNKLKRKTIVEDEIGGEKITIKYNMLGNAAKAYTTEGKEITSIRLYWFAWYAFHPDTKIY